MQVYMLSTVAYAAPVLDGQGKPQHRIVKFGNVEQKVPATETQYCFAGSTYEVPDKDAKEFLARGFAREVDPELDDGLDDLDTGGAGDKAGSGGSGSSGPPTT